MVCLLLYVTKYNMYMVESRALKAQCLGSEPSSRDVCVIYGKLLNLCASMIFICYMGMII